jgi:polyhydroxyalkanoate synthesis regulator phasin
MVSLEYSGRRIRQFFYLLVNISKEQRKKPKPVDAKMQDRLLRIESGISQLIVNQKQEYDHLKELDEKIITDMELTKEEMRSVEKEIQALEERLTKIKNLPEDQANSLRRRISRMKTQVKMKD